MVEAGQYVTDGTVTWIVTDVRDGAQVGDIKMSPILRKGYVKANGALLTDAKTNYPRLVNFVQDNPSLLAADDTAWNSNKALYVYDDTNDTLRVPDATGRVWQGGNSVEEKEAGLPNIEGAGVNVYSYGVYPHSWNNGAFDVTHSQYVFNDIVDLPDSSRNRVSYLKFDASHSSPIYGNSTTVQPPAITLIPQIKY